MPKNAELLTQVYDELRGLAAAKLAREKPGQTLSATALVHEAYLRIGNDQSFDGRAHFYASAAEAMRRILIEAARRRQSLKRGGDKEREDLSLDAIAAPDADDEMLALHEALEQFALKDPVKVELVKLRYFAGMTADEAAEVLGISPSTADRAWEYAKAWLKRAMASSCHDKTSPSSPSQRGVGERSN
jgi:RNA polymerase sigma factor (TIGR02999 family)